MKALAWILLITALALPGILFWRAMTPRAAAKAAWGDLHLKHDCSKAVRNK